MRRSPYNHALAQASIAVDTHTTGTVTGDTVDLIASGQRFRTAMIVVYTGAMTDGTHTISVQHAPDNDGSPGDWVDVPDDLLQGTAPAMDGDDDNEIFELGYVGHERFVRVVSTVADGANGGTYGALVILEQPHYPPVERS